MKKIIVTLLIVTMFISYGGIKDTNALTLKLEDQQNTAYKNIPYSIRSSMSFALREKAILSMYGKCDKLRKLKGGYSYEVRNLKDGSKLFVMYNLGMVYDIWRLKKLLSPKDFSKIKIGTSTPNDIKTIDPYFQLWDNNNNQGLSEHRLQNNKVAVISYTKKGTSWVVSSIKYMTDPSNFSIKILAEDLKEIS